jgi:hypothetical protein
MRAVVVGCVCILALGALVLGASMAGAAITPASLGKCIDLTGTSSLRVNTENLSLTRDQVKEVRARFTDYRRDPSAFPAALDGIGLTPEQTAEIMRRVQAWIKANTRQVGAPCPPFKNRQKVIQRVKALLIYNGFRPAMTFSAASPRQLTFRAIQDGIE